MKRVIFAAAVMHILSCSTMDMHFNANVLRTRPDSILIGHIESRTVTYRPYAASNLRDALRFEFFRHGFRSGFPENEEPAPRENVASDATMNPEQEKAQRKKAALTLPNRASVAALCAEHSADVFICGSFSESETGDYADTRTTTLVTLLVYDRSGEKVGEVRYLFGDTMADASIAKTAAARLAGAVVARFP